MTLQQRRAAKHNIKKAQKTWQRMSPKERSQAQPTGRSRTKPGAKSTTGNYYHITVRPKHQFYTFRAHDVGRSGHTKRVAGKRNTGNWDTQKWLVSKRDAHVEGDHLVVDDNNVKKITDSLQSDITRVKGDIFEAKPKRNIPEKEKPTAAQQAAQAHNIKKAQRARTYEERSKQELYELAKEKEIEGRSRMDKQGLIKALRGR